MNNKFKLESTMNKEELYEKLLTTEKEWNHLKILLLEERQRSVYLSEEKKRLNDELLERNDKIADLMSEIQDLKLKYGHG